MQGVTKPKRHNVEYYMVNDLRHERILPSDISNCPPTFTADQRGSKSGLTTFVL